MQNYTINRMIGETFQNPAEFSFFSHEATSDGYFVGAMSTRP